MECKKCNTPLKQNTKFCQGCGTKVEQDLSSSNSKKIFELSKGETEVKTYYCTTLEDPFAQGYICVTNKRVIYYAFGESSKRFNELYIDKISGINSYYGMGRVTQYLKNAITGVLAAIFFKTVLSDISILMWGSLLVSGFYIYKYFFDKSIIYYFDILSEASNSSGISIGLFGGNITGQGAAISTKAIPTQQTHVMMKELGAMILDLKNLGDHAVEMWKEESTMEEIQHSKGNSMKENIFK